MASKRAMVIGCKGMDGSHMVDLLNSKGYEVWGISHSDDPSQIKRYAKQVDEIYNFAGKSDVINPFENVNELEDIWKIPLIVLDQIKETNVKFFQAGSPLATNPSTPYGSAKEYAHSLIRVYRDKFKGFLVNGILYPHCSERQKDHFFIKKVCKAAINREKVQLGDLNQLRDYGYAPQVVEIIFRQMQFDNPKDFVFASGLLYTLRDFVKWAFEFEGLDYRDYVTESEDSREGAEIYHNATTEYYICGRKLIGIIMNKMKDARTI